VRRRLHHLFKKGKWTLENRKSKTTLGFIDRKKLVLTAVWPNARAICNFGISLDIRTFNITDRRALGQAAKRYGQV
jgi:hypothetical protein